MPSVTSYTPDGMWQVELTAFKVNLLVYKAVGATLVVRRKEMVRTGLFGWGGLQERWVERPAESLSVANTYRGLLPSTVEGAAQGRHQTVNESRCDCRLWAVGVAVTAPATADSGLPDAGHSSPGGAATLEVRSVTSVGTAVVDGQVVTVGPVAAS